MITMYRSVACALSDYIKNRLALLNATDAVIQAPADLAEVGASEQGAMPLEVVVLTSDDILDAYFRGHKIEAIKVLRQRTGADLKECKDAICSVDSVPVIRAAMTAILESRIGR